MRGCDQQSHGWHRAGGQPLLPALVDLGRNHLLVWVRGHGPAHKDQMPFGVVSLVVSLFALFGKIPSYVSYYFFLFFDSDSDISYLGI